jgi:hypothetical protein
MHCEGAGCKDLKRMVLKNSKIEKMSRQNLLLNKIRPFVTVGTNGQREKTLTLNVELEECPTNKCRRHFLAPLG